MNEAATDALWLSLHPSPFFLFFSYLFFFPEEKENSNETCRRRCRNDGCLARAHAGKTQTTHSTRARQKKGERKIDNVGNHDSYPDPHSHIKRGEKTTVERERERENILEGSKKENRKGRFCCWRYLSEMKQLNTVSGIITTRLDFRHVNYGMKNTYQQSE